MIKPIAVCISDIHFSIQNLALASTALSAALKKAEELDIPLIIAGDLNDTKAIIRAEVANAIISILKGSKVKIHILAGNHDLINEKGSEHGLNYLRPYAYVISEPQYLTSKIFLAPYMNNTDRFCTQIIMDMFDEGLIMIMHQGFMGAQMGDYIQDKTSLDPSFVRNFKVISGHYHRHQTLGTVTYIGSPYTITYGEANDGPKGFLILNEDGSFTREILNLRKHIILNRDLQTANDPIENYNESDLVWLKITGPKVELDQLNKTDLGLKLFGHSNFKLDLLPIEENNQKQLKVQNQQDWEILDSIIDSSSHDNFVKEQLKALYRELNETT